MLSPRGRRTERGKRRVIAILREAIVVCPSGGTVLVVVLLWYLVKVVRLRGPIDWAQSAHRFSAYERDKGVRRVLNATALVVAFYLSTEMLSSSAYAQRHNCTEALWWYLVIVGTCTLCGYQFLVLRYVSVFSGGVVELCSVEVVWELGTKSLMVPGMGLQLCGLQVWCWLVSTILWLVLVERQLDLSSVTARLGAVVVCPGGDTVLVVVLLWYLVEVGLAVYVVCRGVVADLYHQQ
ncbi:hypothetical protein Taro_009377 [Colocasia esculenta]|uniref:Uncharacterized protein n=1 Tax=Colocasia esculenta TaxID=4460 RepID=A0A843U0Q0_COLES|nr:hypothetical protein [Colocasia esculenta]